MRFEDLGGWSAVLDRLTNGQSLGADEAACVLGQVLSGQATPAQIGGFLVGLRAKGATTDEMTGLVRALMAQAKPVPLPPDLLDVVDVVGTGGDRLSSINVSTMAALIAAGAGARVCKHGNRAISSSVGTADVLEALGVAVDLDGRGVARCVVEVGMGFCFAQRFHGAMRFVNPARRDIGVPTVFNFLGPLANPARARRQLVGVSDPAMAHKMAEVLGVTGSTRAMVVHGDDGLDELSVTSPSTVLDLVGDGHGAFEVTSSRVEPEELGFSPATIEDLRGGDAAFNAGVIRSVLSGDPGPRRDIGVLNAAAALVVAGQVGDLKIGVERAMSSIDEGHAEAVLDGLVRVSQEAAASAVGA